MKDAMGMKVFDATGYLISHRANDRLINTAKILWFGQDFTQITPRTKFHAWIRKIPENNGARKEGGLGREVREEIR